MPRDYPPRSYNNPPAPAPNLLLDTITGAGAAYSVRRVRGTYSGPLLQVRRSSDNATQDIGYTAQNDLDIATLTSFCGTDSAFVSVWYDQSGNARDLLQATVSAQPLLVSAGTLNTKNGKAAVKGDGTAAFLQNTSPFMYGSGAANIHTVIAGPGSQSSGVHVGETNSASANTLYDFRPSATNADTPAQFFRNDANSTYVSNSTAGTQIYLNNILNTLSNIDSGTNISHFVNGVQSFSGGYSRPGVSSLNRFTMFASGRPTIQGFLNAHIAEVIIYGLNNTTTNRQAVEANQKAYFGTP